METTNELGERIAAEVITEETGGERMILELTPEDCIHTEAIYEVCVNGGEAWDEIMEWMLDSDMFSFYKRNPDGVFKGQLFFD